MAEYLSPAHQQRVEQLLSSWTVRTEWPTWLMVLLVYGAWVGTLALAPVLGPWPTTFLLIIASAWHMSLQHELLHGHPTRKRWFNKILAYPPLAVWFPYTLYLESHLRHHNDANLTLPDVDPETHYVSEHEWARSGWFMRAMYWQRKHFWGRFVFGPAMAIVSMLREAVLQLREGNTKYVPMWTTHLALLVLILWTVDAWAGIHPLHYLFGIAYPALSLAMVRSYYEHRAADDCKHRIVINEAAWPMRMLFLNNNYHLVHHDLPSLPWYLLPEVYWADRDAYIARSGGFRVGGYLELARRFSFKAVDAPLHPHAAAAVNPRASRPGTLH